MPSPFLASIHQSLANPTLQSALDNNVERRLKARSEALATLADPQAMRQRARAIRTDVVANLDHYVEQLVARVQENGIIVHRAADAAQAVQIVLQIAQSIGSQTRSPGSPVLIAKSKSMVSEEIRLNSALEAAGLQVVETDLGEYIVQLRNEPPSHIITPAVHLTRQQVSELFHEKLGEPLTDDIPTMTAAARRKLRQVFLSADIGLSGVNVAAVETGTLCVLTNEGNGRMVTTMPRVHIALMGLERLVPTLDDLAVILALLPRSATGQKITVYANLIHGPRRSDDPDGPQERHLILLDNGRMALRQSPLAEALYCIRCGACLNVCPVFRELGGHAYVSNAGEHSAYPGPIGSVLAPALFGAAEFGHLARASSLCGVCKEACPVDIDLPKLLLRVRAGMTARQPSKPNAPGLLKWGLGIFSRVAAVPWLYHLSQRLVGLAGRLVSPHSAWLRLPPASGWGYSKDFPRPAVTPFSARWKQHQPERSLASTPMPPILPVSESIAPTTTSLHKRFAQELTALSGNFTLCKENELSDQILALLKENGIETIVAWEEAYLPAGLLNALRVGGITVTHTPDAAIQAGLTGALAGVAETGSLVLPGGPGRALTTSLLPEIHIAVLRAREIRENLVQVLAMREVREAAAAVLVSGPSRTADIEMTLALGVHGPRQVHVFCV